MYLFHSLTLYCSFFVGCHHRITGWFLIEKKKINKWSSLKGNKELLVHHIIQLTRPICIWLWIQYTMNAHGFHKFTIFFPFLLFLWSLCYLYTLHSVVFTSMNNIATLSWKEYTCQAIIGLSIQLTIDKWEGRKKDISIISEY